MPQALPHKHRATLSPHHYGMWSLLKTNNRASLSRNSKPVSGVRGKAGSGQYSKQTAHPLSSRLYRLRQEGEGHPLTHSTGAYEDTCVNRRFQGHVPSPDPTGGVSLRFHSGKGLHEYSNMPAFLPRFALSFGRDCLPTRRSC